ncbi:MAG: hypothetical protein IJA12_00310 [Oscillospiraceae bacterium]|nr:hypothetical protein [Oscillospiraceae bacterium]
MNCFDIARRIRVRHLRFESKEQLISMIAVVIIYFALSLLLPKFCPNLSRKVINIISVAVSLVVAFVLIFIL